MKNSAFIALTVLYLCLNGCTHLPEIPSLKTWLQPYERELLADPYMNFNHDPITQDFRRHVYETREGANGGFNSKGGGCGCN